VRDEGLRVEVRRLSWLLAPRTGLGVTRYPASCESREDEVEERA
jgi:hypothetical protein